MGWFRIAGDGGDDPSRYVVTVRRAEDDTTAGAGLVLGHDTVLTCAHVVNAALGRDMFHPTSPGPRNVPLEVRTSALATQRTFARVAHWIPPRSRDGGRLRPGTREWLGDLAVLRVDIAAPGLPGGPRQSSLSVGQKLHAWHGSSRDSTVARLTVAALHGPHGYVDGAATGMAIGPGYSGGPLWCQEENAVVGLVAGHFMPVDAAGHPLPLDFQNVIRRSWVIPWQAVEAELQPLGVLERARPLPPDTDEHAYELLVAAIEDALPSPSGRGDCARRLARLCAVAHDSDVRPPSAEEFAAFLLTHPRALAALTGLLRRDDPRSADRLLTAGALSRTPRLLTPSEYADLRGHLRALDPAVTGRFPEAVRAALPHLAAQPGDDSPDALVDHLEILPGDGHASGDERRVPALLRVIEYIGALVPEPRRARLRMWSDAVAVRLGIDRSALGERRYDAQEWARSVRGRAARVRVLVQVTKAGRGRHRLRIWCDEGAGPRQVSTESVRTYTASEAAREVLRVLDSLTPPPEDERPPLVEVLVDRGGLNLPVDEWAVRDPAELVPGVLGVEFPLVVHCPELLRRNGRFVARWRSRWSRLDTGKALVVSDPGDRDALYSQLVNQLDTVRVFVDVPPGPPRDRIVQTCLALGIPVVLWDRGEDGPSHSVRQMAEVATRELPDGVHSYRASAQANPPEFPGRPVLAWADADRTVPRLHLSEPQEGP
ncbi:trypsin-like peptidase domain-containing protein [Streptomyces sp. FXJ1.172]|uniref:VMAP-C domain-containing protein n=1 Tax=Streptomyces sp. FXJ1.172 TaxID=710705 RepID=UPI0007CF49EC|nr:trypsin-like peptidase domain-containing protein [Streptomyces sp. FXJ1.172]WEO93928.1 trypsin-like peptidase domain-containing protein [Streptomyces sp. FXJ1.172]